MSRIRLGRVTDSRMDIEKRPRGKGDRIAEAVCKYNRRRRKSSKKRRMALALDNNHRKVSSVVRSKYLEEASGNNHRDSSGAMRSMPGRTTSRCNDGLAIQRMPTS